MKKFNGYYVVYIKIDNKGFTDSLLFESSSFPNNFRIYGIFHSHYYAEEAVKDLQCLADVENKKRGYKFISVYCNDVPLYDNYLIYDETDISPILPSIFRMSCSSILNIIKNLSESISQMFGRIRRKYNIHENR